MKYIFLLLPLLLILFLFYKSSFRSSNKKIADPNERSICMQALFDKCANKYNNENIKNMKVCISDIGHEDINRKEYMFCYNVKIPALKKLCGPDFTFYNWPSANINSFEETTKEIIKRSSETPSIEKVGWFGNTNTHPTRKTLMEIGSMYPHLFDIVHIAPIENVIDHNIDKYITLPDLVKYKYLIDISGIGYSGRLKYLLFSKRPLLLADRQYIEYFYDDLIPYTHFIPVKMDLSDLVTQVEWLKNNERKGNEIAKNAFNFAITNFTEDKILERVYYVYNNM